MIRTDCANDRADFYEDLREKCLLSCTVDYIDAQRML